jgi:hypothetical protein
MGEGERWVRVRGVGEGGREVVRELLILNINEAIFSSGVPRHPSQH